MNDALDYSIVVSLDPASTKVAMDELRKLREQAEMVAQAAQAKNIEATADALKGFNKVIIDTDKSTQTSVNSLAALSKEMDQRKSDLEELAVIQKREGQLTEEQTLHQEEIKVALKAASIEYNNQTRELADVARAGGLAGNTYDELVKQNRALMIEMRKVPLDDTTGQLAKMQGQYKANTERLKEFDGAVGNNFRNVGNYKESILDAIKANTGYDLSTKVATLSTIGLGTAMKAAGIGLIVAGIVALVGALSKMQPVLDFLARRMAELGAAFEYTRDLIGSFIGLNERNNRSMGETIRLARELKQAEQDLADTRIAGLAPMAKARMEISKLREQLNDENLSNAQRLAIIDQALAKEAQLADAEEYLARERFRIAKEQAALNESDRKAIEEVANAEVDLIAVRENSYNRRRELGEKRKTLALAEIATERQAAAEAVKVETELQQQLAKARAFVAPEDDVMAGFDGDLEAEAAKNDKLLQASQEYFRTKQQIEIQNIRASGDEMGAILRERELSMQDIRIQAIRDGITSEDEIRQLQAAKELEYEHKLETAKTNIAKTEIANRSQLMGMAVQGAMKLGTSLFGQSKGMAIAQAIIDTYQAANVALKSAPPPFNFALAAANVAAGVANVMKIKNTKPGSSSVSTSGGSSGVSVPSQSTPSFGTVSASITPMGQTAPTIVLTGDLDSEYLAVKVRRGNDAISSRGITVAST
jgi:hypothetical protein